MSEQKVEQAPPAQGAQAPNEDFFEYLSDNSFAAFRVFYDFMTNDLEKAIAKSVGPISEKVASAVALGKITEALLIIKRILEIMDNDNPLRYTLANAVLRTAQVYSALKNLDDPIHLSDITAKLDVIELDVYIALEKYLEALKQRLQQ